MPSIDEIVDNFEFLDDWEDRYRYVIELGNGLEPLSADEHAPEYKVPGCASQVWLLSEIKRGPCGIAHIHYRGDSDAHIVRGLIAILFAIYSGKSAQDIIAADAQAIFTRIGLKDHLTQQRANGLASMVARIRADAACALESADRPL